MKTIKFPDKTEWPKLIVRPADHMEELEKTVNQIFLDIRKNGDKAVKKYTLKYDKVELKGMRVTENELSLARNSLSDELISAIELAIRNIGKFHLAQIENAKMIETSKGVFCCRESRPIEKVGFYIPGGTAPLFSTVLMLGIPAKLAGCKEIILCTPPDKKGNIDPVILWTAMVVGVTSIFKVGGIQAIGAMTFGTETIPKVDKIFGPGNQFVTAAKQMAQKFKVAIDMPAGPSEILIIGDSSSNPEFVAADLLSQAEHGPDSQVILLSDDLHIIASTIQEINKQLKNLPRKEIAVQALKNSKAILFESLADCFEFSNLYAPEHLVVVIKDAHKWTKSIRHAGSVFLGKYSCESAGDYISGTNHVLPTNGYARNYSGISLDSFIKKISFQQLSRKGLRNIGPSIEYMAEAEQLIAHKNAVTVRLKKIAAESKKRDQHV